MSDKQVQTWTLLENGRPPELQDDYGNALDYFVVWKSKVTGMEDVRSLKYANGHFRLGPENVDANVVCWAERPNLPNEEERGLKKEERVKKFGEVFTPRWVVEKMCDMLEQENGEDPYAPESTFLEPACGDGVFVLEILKRKFVRCKSRKDFSTAINSVWGMEIQESNVKRTIESVEELCEEWFSLNKADREAIKDHIIQADSLKVMKMIAQLEEHQSIQRGW